MNRKLCVSVLEEEKSSCCLLSKLITLNEARIPDANVNPTSGEASAGHAEEIDASLQTKITSAISDLERDLGNNEFDSSAPVAKENVNPMVRLPLMRLANFDEIKSIQNVILSHD